MYSVQIKEGENYDVLLPVVMMILTRFLLFQELEKLHNTFLLTAQDSPGFVLTGDIQFPHWNCYTKNLGSSRQSKKRYAIGWNSFTTQTRKARMK